MKQTKFKERCKQVLLMLLATSMIHATSSKILWTKWTVNNPLSTAEISHRAWNEFLKKYVTTNEEGINLVDYQSLNKAELKSLKKYIETMSHANIGNYNRNEQLAYWINLYNALTIQTIAAHYSAPTLQKINVSSELLGVGLWKQSVIEINHTPLSLDDIKNRIIRPIWNDPRTLYAVNNATIGAANLSNQAYRGVSLEGQLNNAATSYINSLRGVEVIEGKLVLSQLFEWYKEDFGGSNKNVIQHIEHFAKEPLLSQLKHVNTVDCYSYNWHLNIPARHS
jgi:hypothetical protein